MSWFFVDEEENIDYLTFEESKEECLKKEEELSKKVEELLNLKDEIHEAIATVNDPVMELVLTYRYINCYDWNNVADKLGYALSHVYNLHRKALSLVKLKDDSKS